ncbi:MAG: hypothetical protein JO182_18545 [Acidobacteriaceae bacterium]|nr:hypothetical protein [Acidobacteriaceae bacterium]MBV9676646.1 hypothetical protein [Acidobacteriaceae bacterium]
MSASPHPFYRVKRPNRVVIQAPTSFTRVMETDDSVVGAPANKEISDVQPDNPSYEVPQASNERWTLYFASWMLASLLAGLIAGRVLYLLWEHVASHDRQLAWHQAAIEELTKTQTQVSDQAKHLKALDTSVDTVQALFNEQSRRLADLEKGQAGLQSQLNGMNARWQRQINELRKEKAQTAPNPVPKSLTENPAPAKSLPQVQPASDKHNETFSPDLKPTPSSYAQILPSGLVVWMTPRPGSPNPVPTSVIGYVRGAGMLVHDWDDNKHYFISDSGEWLADQR